MQIILLYKRLAMGCFIQGFMELICSVSKLCLFFADQVLRDRDNRVDLIGSGNLALMLSTCTKSRDQSPWEAFTRQAPLLTWDMMLGIQKSLQQQTNNEHYWLAGTLCKLVHVHTTCYTQTHMGRSYNQHVCAGAQGHRSLVHQTSDDMHISGLVIYVCDRTLQLTLQ